MAINSLLIAVWIASIHVSRKLYRDIFTPLCVYVTVWCACLLLYRLSLVNYYELETRTYLLIGGSMLAFVVGCVVAHDRKNSTRTRLLLPLERGRLETTIKVLLLLNLIGVILFAWEMHSQYGLTTYFSYPAEIRRDAGNWTHMGLLGSLVLLHYPLLAASFIHVLMKKRFHWFSALGLLWACAQTYLFTDRGTLTVFLLTITFVGIYVKGWHTVNRKVIVIALLVMGLVLAYFISVGHLYAKLIAVEDPLLRQTNINPSSTIALLLLNPYLYATGSFPALQEAIGDVHHFDWGEHTFYPVARVFYGAGLLEKLPDWTRFEFYSVPIPFNTYTYLFTFYQDFGIPGMILCPFALGWLETRLYLTLKTRPSIFALGAMAAFMVVNVFSVFVTLTSTIMLWYYLLMMFVISELCRRRKTVAHHGWTTIAGAEAVEPDCGTTLA